MTIRDIGENRMVARFRELASAASGKEVLVGSGDDAAVVSVAENRLLLLTCDMMVEGVHFRRDWASAEQIGWKAMVQNVSDIAAMGGEPAFAVASLAAPGALSGQVVEEIAEGLVAAASEYGAALVGGDLVGSQGPIVVDVALTGWVEKETMLLRRGAHGVFPSVLHSAWAPRPVSSPRTGTPDFNFRADRNNGKLPAAERLQGEPVERVLRCRLFWHREGDGRRKGECHERD